MPPEFLCDAMMGGLARWLRAAGYPAEFDVKIEDGELVRRALQEEKVIVTSDSGILKRYAVREGLVRSVYLRPGLSPVEQLSRVLSELGLGLHQPRCMECGGALADVTCEEVEEQLPPRVRRNFEQFFRCRRCSKVYWQGSHWDEIRDKLRWAAGKAE